MTGRAVCITGHPPHLADIATWFLATIEASFEPLRHFPHAGPAREQLAAGLRVTFHTPNALHCKPLQGAVVILRIVHGAHDIAAFANRSGFA